jgi:hypothetical protein
MNFTCKGACDEEVGSSVRARHGENGLIHDS